MAAAQNPGYSLRFYGNGADDIDRVKIRIDDPQTNVPGPPADVGATDFTIEFWMRALARENRTGTGGCGVYNWINGNIILDRDRFNQGRAFGISITDGVIAFGVGNAQNSAETICGQTNVLDEQWHHIAVQRRRNDGRMFIYVDGRLDAEADGPDGDISYPDDGTPGNFCNGPCTNSDPFLVIGAEKHDAGSGEFPSFSGWFDELRISNVLRYSADFTVMRRPFVPDGNTVALYHFDEGAGATAFDLSGAAGGPSNGQLRIGGTPQGPEWSLDTPFDMPVPVSIGLMSARVSEQGFVVIQWRTESELNNYGFEVQRRLAGMAEFETLSESFQPGHGTTSTPQNYTYLDSTVTAGRWSYRLRQTDHNGTVDFSDALTIEVSSTLAGASAWRLDQNYPNPFNASTRIAYSVPRRGHVRLSIYSVAGREVRTLVDAVHEAGSFSCKWDGKTDAGIDAESGIYFYRMRLGAFSRTERLILLR